LRAYDCSYASAAGCRSLFAAGSDRGQIYCLSDCAKLSRHPACATQADATSAAATAILHTLLSQPSE
jgi:hypothetical protein